MASVRVTDNTNQVRNNVIQKASIFLRLAAEEVIRVSTPNTPKKTGRLRADVIRQVLGLSGKVKWGKNYAKFQETKQFKNYTTAGTGPHYAENAVRDVVRKTSDISKRAGLT